MTAENWIKIKETLQAALALKAHEREKFLAGSGLSAAEKAEIESLLEFETESEKFLSVSAGGLAGGIILQEKADAGRLVGQKIGIYEITGEIGVGGMGAVYLAERKDGKFAQRVAIKMLKREYNVKKIRRHFARETEIQSKLDHPNIARLLDSGTTEDGIPFLVMEYVKGLPIDRFCRETNPSLNARLKLFNKVCEAVALAHRNLIIHRDLKPSNILVTAKGEPKLLDFGISKLLDSENQEMTLTTAFGAMTPEYASPEQLKGENVTTAADVYSLGVVLYKILTGRHPFEIERKNKSALIKTIIENEPTKPSAVADETDKNPPSAVRRPLLKGDIDNIILKALSKEPSRRYQSVEQFSADIWRYIDGLPVGARSSTVGYRAEKFFRRNKIAVVAAILVALSLFTGVVISFWQANIARAQAQIADESRNLAETETSKAKAEQQKSEKITKFMSKIIGYASPAWYAEGAKFGGKAQVVDALEDLSEKIDTEFADEPDVAAELHHKFGEAIGWAARNETDPERQKRLKERARFHVLRALELRKQFYGEWHELVAKDLFYAYTIITEDPRERARLLSRAMSMMRETNPENLNFPYIIEAYTACLILPKYEEIHGFYRDEISPAAAENRYQLAERLLRESLPVFRHHYKSDNSAIFAAECKLAYALAMQRKWTDFDEHYAVCRQYGDKSARPDAAKNTNAYLELIEKAMSGENR